MWVKSKSNNVKRLFILKHGLFFSDYSTLKSKPSSQHSFFFDMDGVLCNSELINAKSHFLSINLLKNKFNLSFKLPSIEILQNYTEGRTTKNAIDLIVRQFPQLSKFRREYFEISGIYFNRLKFEMKEDYFIQSSIKLVKQLLIENYKICIVSGSPCKEIDSNIKKLNFDSSIPFIGAESCVNSKPHPEPYLRAAKLLNVNPNRESCIAFEDSVSGVISAKSAGMFVVGLSRTDLPKRDLKKSGADIILNDLSEFNLETVHDAPVNSFLI